MKKHLGVDTVSRTKNVVGAVPAVAFDAAGIILRTASITRRDLGSLAELVASTLRAGATAPTLLADQPLRYSRLALPIVVGNVVGIITAVSIDFPGIIASAAAVVGLDLITFAKAAPARRPRTRPRSVLLADQAFGDARLALPIIIGDVVGIVSAVPIDLSGVELAPAPIVRFDLISLAEPIASAVGIAAPAIKRRDEAGLDPSLGFAIVLCERPLARDPKKVSGAVVLRKQRRKYRQL